MKKIIFLVDHKHRDFPSISLIGYFLHRKGHKVYFKRIHEPDVEIINPDVIVEAKYSRPEYYRKKIKKWQEKNIKVIVMETEGIIQWKGFTPLMNYKPDFCFFWNKNHGYQYDKSFYEDKTIILGCPRSDFLHKNLRQLTKNKSIFEDLDLDKNIKTITVATPNSYEDLSEEKLLNVKKRYNEVHKSSASFETLITHMKESRKSIQSFCKSFSNSNLNCNLIIKPHPNENINYWNEFVKKLNDKRVKILVGKSIQDLLNVSDLHVAKSGCLTLPEASLLEINTIELLSLSESSKQILFDNHMFLGTYNIEKFLEIEQDLHNILNNEINNEIKNNHKNKLKKYIENYFYKYDGKRCFEYSKVLDEYLRNENNFIKKKKNFMTLFSFMKAIVIKAIKLVYRSIRYNETLIDNRGRFDNRIKGKDKDELFLKYDKNNYIQNLSNDL